jgi:hypothetical protein
MAFYYLCLVLEAEEIVLVDILRVSGKRALRSSSDLNPV